MYPRIDDAPDAPGGTPDAPRWRARSLVLTPFLVASVIESCDDEGPKRLTRHERVSEDGHQRGR